MKSTGRILVAVALAALAAGPRAAAAKEAATVACSVSVDYLLNGALRSSYRRDFTVTPGAAYSDDFSTVTRFRFFDASARAGDDHATVVSASYYNDVGVVESVDFATEVTVRDDGTPASTSASHTYWSSFGVAGNHTTRWTLTCTALDD